MFHLIYDPHEKFHQNGKDKGKSMTALSDASCTPEKPLRLTTGNNEERMILNASHNKVNDMRREVECFKSVLNKTPTDSVESLPEVNFETHLTRPNFKIEAFDKTDVV